MFSLLVYTVVPLLFIPGALLLVLGWRGRRIDDHPWCRKCRFDLFGLADPQTCPECGRDLTKAKAVRIGQRRKRRGMVAFGGVMLFISVTAGSLYGWAASSNIDWQQMKPVWWLVMEADGQPGAVFGQGPTAAKMDTTSDMALDELRRRQDAGELTNEQVIALVERALVHQANQQRTWQPEWGNLVETARIDGLVSDRQWQTYAAQFAVDLHKLEVRTTIQHGVASIGVRLREMPARMGNRNLLKFWVNVSDAELRVGSVVKMRRGVSWGSQVDWDGNSSSTTQVHLSEKDWQAIQPGKQKVAYLFDLTVFEAAPTMREGEDEPLVRRRIETKADVEITAADEPTVKLITDPAIGKQVEAAITLNRLFLQPWGGDNDQTVNIQGSFFVKPRPVDIAFEVFLRLGEEEVRGGSINVEKSKETGYGLGWAKLPESFVGQKVDVVLRPSKKVASESVDCFEIWGEEIVFEDVLLDQMNKSGR